MRKRLLTAVITATAATGAMAVSAMANNGAQPTPLNDNVSSFSCDGAVGGTPGGSFAVIKSGNGTVSAQVELKHALPNTGYRVNLIQGGCSSQTAPFVTTNGQGNASIHLSAPQTSNTASVLANSHGARDMKQTAEVNVGP